jgi:F-type H+-transporting ATPase subunit delta
MAQVAQVYARALFEAASEGQVLDTVKEQLAQFDDALGADWQFQLFFFSPNFSTAEKKEGVRRAVVDAEPVFVNFLEALIERHRISELSRIRERYDQLWDAEMKVLPVEVTTAVPLDEATLAGIGERIGAETGNRIQLTSVVDPNVVGGMVLRVGNMVLDASIHSRLNQLRKQVSKARIGSPLASSVKEPSP